MSTENILSFVLEILTISANIGLVVTVYFLISERRTKNKIISINYNREFLNKIQNNPTLRDTNNKINNNKEKDCDVKNIDIFLNEYEDLAYFWIQKVVKLNHIKEIHGAVLSKIKTSDKVQKYIKEKRLEDKFYFSSLVKLLKKID